jgi:hypothetical protein
VIEEEDDIFERVEEESADPEVSMKGGVKGARRQQESMAAAVALAGRLGGARRATEEIEIDIDAI